MQTVFRFFKQHWKIFLVITLSLLLIMGKIITTYTNAPTWVTETVTRGTVSRIISVSGTINATENAKLSFPTTGILESVSVKEGDIVEKDTVLATLRHDDLNAEYRDTQASLQIAEADYNELIKGIRPEERDITKTKLEIAKEELARVTKEQNDRVQNAYRTLISSDLEMRPLKNNNNDTPPIVTGAYTCGEGEYQVAIFRSASYSGYSYRTSGIEDGTFTAYTESAAPVGACGLSLQFVAGENYGNSTWAIQIPNTESTSYVTNLNSYTLAVTARENAIRTAEQNLVLTTQNTSLDTADPRSESLTRAQARVLQAQARVESVESKIHDHILTAPFSGTITRIDPVPGETVGGEPVITIVSKNTFELTALIPEIDVTKIKAGQKANVAFDARPDETLTATIAFISPLAREIAGVSYFETTLTLDAPTSWLQSGLNADIDIVAELHENVLRIPKRFLIEDDGTYAVFTPQGEEKKKTDVTMTFEGNDGFVEIIGLNEGDTIIIP